MNFACPQCKTDFSTDAEEAHCPKCGFHVYGYTASLTERLRHSRRTNGDLAKMEPATPIATPPAISADVRAAIVLTGEECARIAEKEFDHGPSAFALGAAIIVARKIREGIKATIEQLNLHVANDCPVCGQFINSQGFGIRRNSHCIEGHEWHTCTVHGKLVLGNVPDGTLFVCTCESVDTPVSTGGEKAIASSGQHR
jgi:hypothetical protein